MCRVLRQAAKLDVAEDLELGSAPIRDGKAAGNPRADRPAPYARLRFGSFLRAGFRQEIVFAVLLGWATRSCLPAMPSNPINPHLPPHLREVCRILASGLLRLRSRAAEEAAREAADQGEQRLHFPAPQRPHSNRNNRRLA